MKIHNNNQIHILPENLVNQIAAGEVIERPASAIKELVDNSIDAGATQIQIQIISSDGRSFRITDNGIGIPENQIELAFTKHATSKLSSLEDLTRLQTKGFRGEALASINSVAEVICITKSIHSDSAIKAFFDKDGKFNKIPVAMTKGTCFEVGNLFSNTPVRLKFLKKPETELKAIEEIIREIAIAHEDISFDLEIKSKQIFRTSGSGDWQQTVKEIFQESIDFKYLEIIREQEPVMELRGLIAPTSECRSDSKAIITLVNRRPIQCQIMRKAIKSVYQPYIPSGKYPRLILSLTLSMEQIDINVHPTKREIRYASPNLVYQLVQNSLEKHLIIASSRLSTSDNNENNNEQIPFKEQFHKQYSNDYQPQTKYEKNNIEKSEEREPYFEKLLEEENKSEISEINNKNEFKHILHVSSLTLKKENKAENKRHRADIGNSTDFCLQNTEFLLSGQINGPKWIREQYLDLLSQWLNSIENNWDKFNEQERTNQIQIFPFNVTLNEKSRPKISQNVLESIWEKDNWRCVYCGKHLIHPKVIKENLKNATEDWIQKLGSHNQIIKTHLYREHQASFDHYFPYSNNPSLNRQEDNLYASCRACNQAKSNSKNYDKWQPKRYEASVDSIEIGKALFLRGQII